MVNALVYFIFINRNVGGGKPPTEQQHPLRKSRSHEVTDLLLRRWLDEGGLEQAILMHLFQSQSLYLKIMFYMNIATETCVANLHDEKIKLWELANFTEEEKVTHWLMVYK